MTNPYNHGTDEYVDFEIWNNGVERFNDPAHQYSKHSLQPHELDYLRGFHHPATLDVIQARLAAVTRKHVKVTSFWLDKTAYVFPSTPGVSTPRRELADLAVILHDYSQNHHVMWILQAKKSDDAADPLPSGSSTQKEIELFEKSPQFELEQLPKGKTKLAFDLEPEFGSPANSASFRHWSFLMFRQTPSAPHAAAPSPVQWRWNGSDLHPQTGSFMKGITEMLHPPSRSDHKGAKLLKNGHNGWKALHDALMTHLPATTILGHARGPMRISTFYRGSPLIWWISSHHRQLSNYINRGVANWLPALKFDMITTGFSQNEKLQGWKKRVSDNDFWREAEKSITQSIDRAINSENSDDESQGHADADFVGGGMRPPENNADGEDGDGANPARATLIIEIRHPRNY